VFRADFSQSSGVERCFLVGSLSELWKWHRKLGHLSFDLLGNSGKPVTLETLRFMKFVKCVFRIKELSMIQSLESAKPRNRELVKTRSHDHAKPQSHERAKLRSRELVKTRSHEPAKS
jgi:hypothetical protein